MIIVWNNKSNYFFEKSGDLFFMSADFFGNWRDLFFGISRYQFFWGSQSFAVCWTIGTGKQLTNTHQINIFFFVLEGWFLLSK